MKLSVAWLREMVDLPDDVEELCERLTLLGLEVEELTPFELRYPGVVVGHVLDARPHPNADRLRVCRVSTGEEELSVVCGAPNVRQGLKVAFAAVGGVLPGDFKIKKTKIRGELSLGMICSERELGLGEGHEGILELEEGAVVGTPIDRMFGVSDTCIEIEVTPNRPDWLSHLGVARELAAYYRVPLRLPEVGPELGLVEEDEGWRIRVEDAEGCPRFTGRRMDGVRVGPAPHWMRQRLLCIGQRPINAVVDASNYVLHELGHPNHCFDRRKIAGSTIVLRRARAGECFTTLDDVERELGEHHLLVADEEKGLALAGIMGGSDSEVDATSTELLLEVAVFDPSTIRRGRRSVGLNTDASYRFERGVDFEAAPFVSRRLAHLIQQVAGGTASPVAVEGRGRTPAEPARFFVRSRQVERVVGVPVAPAEMAGMLERLGVSATVAQDGVDVVQPSFRHDLLEEIDAIEEIARHHGFDRLPTAARAPMLRPAERSTGERLRRKLRDHLSARGFAEVLGSSFMPEGDPDGLGLPATDPRRRVVRVLNPIAQGEAALRTTALPEMLRMIGRNRRRGHTGPIRLFQLDRCFVGREGEPLPEEPEHLLLAWSGPAHGVHFSEPSRDFDMLDVLGELDALGAALGLEVSRVPGEGEIYHRPGSGLALESGERRLGSAGELAASVRKRFELDEDVHVAELSLEALEIALPPTRDFVPFSVYPPVRRDLSLVVPRTVGFEAVAGALDESLGPLLETHEVFDLYEGEGLPEGTRAIGVRLSLRSPSGTLKDKKVDGMIARLLERLRERHGIELRA